MFLMEMAGRGDIGRCKRAARIPSRSGKEELEQGLMEEIDGVEWVDTGEKVGVKEYMEEMAGAVEKLVQAGERGLRMEQVVLLISGVS